MGSLECFNIGIMSLNFPEHKSTFVSQLSLNSERRSILIFSGRLIKNSFGTSSYPGDLFLFSFEIWLSSSSIVNRQLMGRWDSSLRQDCINSTFRCSSCMLTFEPIINLKCDANNSALARASIRVTPLADKGKLWGIFVPKMDLKKFHTSEHVLCKFNVLKNFL